MVLIFIHNIHQPSLRYGSAAEHYSLLVLSFAQTGGWPLALRVSFSVGRSL